MTRKDHQPLLEYTQGDDFNFARVTHFDRSASFGFNDDKLGRLNEINR